jgi:hypothetical protein
MNQTNLTQASNSAANHAGQQETGIRLAIISTPRTGNTWLRHLLSYVYQAAELACHNPADLDWSGLPRNCILQVHWHRTAAFQAILERHGFHVAVLARHPLDVLLSILHYSLHDGSTRQWLDSEEGTEAPICGAMPTSTAFAKYATGRRAAALLSISRQWWDVPEASRVHYEDLVADPAGQLAAIVKAVAIPVRRPIAEAVAAHTLPRLRLNCGTEKMPENHHHYWQGNPGHWKRLLPAEVAHAIAAAHAELFSVLKYECDSDPVLDRSQAESHWINLNRPELTERLWNYASMKQRLERALATQGELDRRCSNLGNRCTELEGALEQRAEWLAAADQERIRLNAELATAKAAIETLSKAPTERVASLVKRMLRR